MATPIVNTVAATFSTTIPSPVFAVHTRTRWADEWAALPFVYVNRFSWAAAPGLDEAELEYRFGIGAPPGVVPNAVWEPLELLDQYVRITITIPDLENPEAEPTVSYWYGQVVDDDPRREGRFTMTAGDDGEPVIVSRGVQLVRCVGLAHQLAREPISKSVIERLDMTSLTGETEGPPELTIGRALAHNAGTGHLSREDPIRGNAAQSFASKGTYIFAAEPHGGIVWTGWEMIRYWFEYFAPAFRDPFDANVEPIVDLAWHLPSPNDPVASALNGIAPVVATEGRSLFDLVGEIANPRRLFGWTVEVVEPEDHDDYDPAEHGARLKFFSFVGEDLVLGEPWDTEAQTIVPANPTQWTFDYDGAVNITAAELRKMTADRFDQVTVRGARRTSTVTLSLADGTLEPDWTLGQELSYQAGASAVEGYDLLLDFQKREADHLRRAQEHQRRVFRYFRIPQQWDGNVGDGEGYQTPTPAFPVLDPTGQTLVTDTSAPFWRGGLQLLPQTPILTDHNYLPDGTVADGTPPGSHPNHVRARGWIAYGENSGGANLYQPLERPVRTSELDAVVHRGPTWSATLSIHPNCPGVIVDVSGAEQHVIALGRYSPQIWDRPPGVDFETLLVTLTMVADDHLEVSEPVAIQEAEGPIRRLVIELSDLRLDFVHPLAVLEMVDGRPSRPAEGVQWLNDDRAIAKSVAQLSYYWYARERRALRLSFKGPYFEVKVGDFLRSVGPAPAEGEEDTREQSNTVVTRVSYESRTNTTTIETEFADLDVTGFLRRPG